MAAVPCPSCRETVRLPSTELPAGATVRCPWCHEIRPADQWTAALPPLATVIDSVGQEMAPDAPVAHDSVLGVIPPPLEPPSDLANEQVASETVDLFEESPELDQSIRDQSVNQLPAADVDLEDDSETEPLNHSSDQADSFDGSVDEELGESAVESRIEERAAEEPTVRWQHRKQPWKPATDSDAVAVADEDEAFYQRRYSTRRPNRVVRFLKLASPSLVALPIIIAIWSMSGFDFSMTSPPDRPAASDDAVAMTSDQAAEQFVPAEENTVTQSPGSDNVATVEPPSETSDVASSDAGEIDWLLRDLQSEGLPVDSSASDSVEAPDSKSSKTVLMRAREQLAQRRNEESDSEPQFELPPSEPPVLRFPSEIPTVGEIVQASAEAAMDTANEPLTEVISEQAVEAVSAGDGEQLPSVTAEPLSVNDTAGRTAEGASEMMAEAKDVEAEKAQEVEQTAVEALSATQSTSVAMPTTNDSVDDQPEHKESSRGLPESSSVPSKQPPQDPRELVATCAAALGVINDLPSDDDRSREATLARLTAFREISQIGDHSFSADSPAVAKVLDCLTDSSRIESGDLMALAELCGAWIGWNKRTTDGMLLIARIVESDAQWSLRLSDGTRLRMEPPAIDSAIARSGRIVAVAKIVSAEQPTVKLLAYRLLGDR